jgi:uncharacterized membrane protein (UPF0127 family)/CheY-like chemotaxis protein
VAKTRFILNVSGWGTVCENALVADHPLRRMRGLIGRVSLPPDEGLLLRPAPAIHTGFMRFPIDAMFLDSELKVLSIVENLPPWRTAANRKARAVLELAAGEVRRRGVEVGDQLLVLDEDPGTAPARRYGRRPGRGADAPHERGSRSVRNGTGEVPGLPARGDESAPVPMQILLVATDRRFRAVASALLERRGCQLTIIDSPQLVLETAAREHPDVVVLDAGRSLTAVAQIAAGVQTLRPPVGVVLVGDQPASGLSALQVLPKWGAFEELFSAIEHAYHERGYLRSLVEPA